MLRDTLVSVPSVMFAASAFEILLRVFDRFELPPGLADPLDAHRKHKVSFDLTAWEDTGGPRRSSNKLIENWDCELPPLGTDAGFPRDDDDDNSTEH